MLAWTFSEADPCSATVIYPTRFLEAESEGGNFLQVTFGSALRTLADPNASHRFAKDRLPPLAVSVGLATIL